MEGSARDQYLVAEVMTATPQKLQLMLVEAAIRFAGRARQLWSERKDEEATDALIRAQDIIGQMLASLDRESALPVVRKVAAVYLFVFRCLMEANCQRDERKLDDALKVLEEERETWRQVCEKFGSRRQLEAAARPAQAPPGAVLDAPAPEASDGFSIEA